MNENSGCKIWGTVASIGPPSKRNAIFVDSPRAGGEYWIAYGAAGTPKNLDERFKARLTTWLVEQRRLGVKCPEITTPKIQEMEQRRDLSAHDRADRLLQCIRQATSVIGETVRFHLEPGLIMYPSMGNLENIDNGSLNHYRMMAWSECSKSNHFDEVEFLLEYLREKNWIEYDSSKKSCTLTVDGYARLAELEKVAIISSQAFVAMWFNDSMNDAYEKGIEPGIRDAGYKALPINLKPHINKIDDEIIAEIRRSRFLVADFTHGDSGARGGVYYEAGFAHGLNIPVIFTCRADLVEKVHFDTRQYNHITWEPGKLEVFRKALADRISAVIGDGLNKT